MQILLTVLISFILALSLSLYGVRIVVNVAHQLNLFDNPNERSSAEKPTPMLGGIAIFFSFVFTSVIGLSGYEFPELIYIVTALMVIFFVGLKDDIVKLPPYKKFIAQIVTVFIIIFLAKIRFTNLHGLFGIWEIGIIPSIMITSFTMVVIINAFNLMDGIDGLAAGLSILVAIVLGSWFFISGHFDFAILSIALIGAIAGFFYFNVYGRQYKVFMGDTGSLVLGTIISILIIRFNEFNIDQTQTYAIASVPAISFGILAYPLIDTLRVMAIRIINHRSPFSADKNHLHHRLLALGFSHKKATYTIIGMNLLFVIFIFEMHNIGILRLMAYTTIIGGTLFMLPAYFIRKRNLIKKNDPVQQLLYLRSYKEIVKNSKIASNLRKQKTESRLINHQTFFQRFNLW